MSYNQLKVKEIEHIFIKIHENACELLEEAELLYKHAKYARSYSCAHLAFEELGKLPMLYTVAIKVNNGVKVDWKLLKKRIKNHERKISQSYSTVMYFESMLEKNNFHLSNRTNGVNFLETLEEIIKNININPFEYNDFLISLDAETEIKIKYSMTKLLNEYKNGSLYADFDEGKFKKPTEKIDKEICEYGLIIAHMQKKFIDVPNFHNDGFHLYYYNDKITDNIKNIMKKYDNLKKTKSD